MKNDCDIVKDLLPNYVENLVSNSTKEYVEQHINKCADCKQALKVIQDDVNKSKVKENKEEQIEMNYFKKSRIRIIFLEIFAITLWLIIIAVVMLYLRKFYLINKIMKNVAKNSEITNYKISTVSADEMTTFYTNGKVMVKLVANRLYGVMYYMNKDDNHVAYIVNTKDKTYYEALGVSYDYDHLLIDEIYEEMTLKDKLVALFTWEVKTEKIDGKKCYYICKDVNKVKAGHEYKFWIDKENYCKVKAITKEDSTNGNPEKTNFYYAHINEVKDFEVKFENIFPDFSTYKKVERNAVFAGSNE